MYFLETFVVFLLYYSSYFTLLSFIDNFVNIIIAKFFLSYKKVYSLINLTVLLYNFLKI